VHNTLGTVLAALGRADLARAAYVRALEIEPHAPWVSSNLCYLEFREGRFAEARRHCEEAIDVAPGLAQAHNNLGLTRAAAGDLEGAENAFLGAGDVASAHYNLGIVHLASGRHLDAARAFEAAIAARPDFTAAKRRAHQVRLQILNATHRKQ
jgi:Flp pilus assembly protein TadD